MTPMPTRSSTPDVELSAPLTLPLHNIDGTVTATKFKIRAAAGTVARAGLMLSLVRVTTGARHLVGISSASGRYEVTGIGQGSAADTQVEHALNEVLAADDGHQNFLDAIASMDTLAVTQQLERSRIFRRAVANAWSVGAGDAPAVIHDAVHTSAETCTATIADLGQALLQAAELP